MVRQGRQYISQVMRVPPDAPLAGMDIVIGLLLVFSSSARTSADAFSTAKQLMPIPAWGALFLIVGGSLAVCLYLVEVGSRRAEGLTSIVRVLGPALCVMWGLMFLLSAVFHDHASFLGVPSFLYLSYRHHFSPTKPVR